MSRSLDAIYADMKAAFENSSAVRMAEEAAHQATIEAAKVAQGFADEWLAAKAELVSVEQDVQNIVTTIAGYV